MRSPRPSLPVLLGIAALVVLALARSGEIRQRAEEGLGRGMPDREAALARGFVLGEDDGVDAATKEDFRRAGLSHLLAVSGQNVVLLALLATPLLAALGIPLRERLVWLLALIAIYVPLAGAGPSIQRAAVMGAAGIVATLAGRRSSRLHALLLALIVTLAVSPSVAADIGWQLSFAAVAGILAFAGPLREWLLARPSGRPRSSSPRGTAGTGHGGRPGAAGHWRRALAEGAAVTIAATLATAPLIAFHFERLSTTALLANLLALPAVAPAMWLGMLAAAASQLPGAPVEPLNLLAAHLLAYVAQIAAWCGSPSWAELHVHLGPGGLAASYLVLALGWLSLAALPRVVRTHFLSLSGRKCVRAPGRRIGVSGGARIAPAVFAAATLLWFGPGVVAALVPGGDSGPSAQPAGLRISILDVGQGDAILLRPPHAPAVLVDGGPPGDDLVAKLGEEGVEQLGAVVLTHDEADHAGGVEELLRRVPVDRLVYARLGRELRAEAAAVAAAHGDSSPALIRLAASGVLRSGRLRLEALWPPPAILTAPLAGADPNTQALVLLVRWGRFSMLLTADAEAEAVPLGPGPIDVLKVAHHGSDDAGLASLLDRTRPRLAVISVGEGNPFGHPTPATLATLAGRGVRTLRTDRDGTVSIEVTAGRIEIDTAG
jgi:competence protein ComEC